jgi:hypothetical protein
MRIRPSATPSHRIQIQVWTARFLGTADHARSFLQILRLIDDGVFLPERWGQFEPLRKSFVDDEMVINKWIEQRPPRSGRNNNLMYFQRSRPRALFDVTLWRQLVPDLNHVHIDLPSGAFVHADGPARLRSMLLRFTEWADAAYAAVRHQAQKLSRRAAGTPLRRLENPDWLTFLGAPYVELLGREHLLRTPCHAAEPIRDGVLLTAAPRPDSPELIESADTLLRMEEHIGPRLFAGAGYPQEPCVVPAFDLSETVVTPPPRLSDRVH